MPAIIIPARLNSTRLPGKLLLKETGYPLLWHTTTNALKSELANVVIIATEDQEIHDEVMKFGVSNVYVVQTPPCNSGTDRIAWVVENVQDFTNDFDIVVNFQGDEPELDGKYADELIGVVENNPIIDVSTLCYHGSVNEYHSPDVVKIVTDHNGRAMYFSRSPIPYGSGNGLNHVGIYAYRRDFLLAIPTMIPTTFQTEKLEQLQWLQSGFHIQAVKMDHKTVGVDTREEYENFVNRHRDSLKKN